MLTPKTMKTKRPNGVRPPLIFIIYTCDFPTPTSQNVFHEKCLLALMFDPQSASAVYYIRNLCFFPVLVSEDFPFQGSWPLQFDSVVDSRTIKMNVFGDRNNQRYGNIIKLSFPIKCCMILALPRFRRREVSGCNQFPRDLLTMSNISIKLFFFSLQILEKPLHKLIFF